MDALRCWLEPGESPDARTLDHVAGTDTSALYPEAWQQNWEDSWYDRVGQVYCNGPWDFEPGDSYTIVAVNGLDPRLDEDGGWDTPNLQHVGFKLAYETFADAPGPNLEVYSSFFDGYEAYGTKVPFIYSIPSSYVGALGTGVMPGTNWMRERGDFKQWYEDHYEDEGVVKNMQREAVLALRGPPFNQTNGFVKFGEDPFKSP
uniref:Uncharacterized protein n=1 Tax=Chloropicon laureae TaxID=464258 RepID=A0A7S2Z5T2_9CHLO